MLKGRKSMNETVNTTMATALNGPGKRPLGSRINMKGSWLGFVYTLAPIPPARTLCITHSLLASIKQYSGLVLVSGSRSKPKLCSLSRRSHACWLYDDLYALATSVDKRNHQSENKSLETLREVILTPSSNNSSNGLLVSSNFSNSKQDLTKHMFNIKFLVLGCY